MKMLFFTIFFIGAILLFFYNYKFLNPSPEELISTLNAENDRLFDPEKDLVHTAFGKNYMARSYSIIFNDTKTKEFKRRVKSGLEVVCFADTLNNIQDSTITPFSNDNRTVEMVILKFSEPCKIGNGRDADNRNKLKDFSGKDMPIYYVNWSQKDAASMKKSIIKWGRMNGAKLSIK